MHAEAIESVREDVSLQRTCLYQVIQGIEFLCQVTWQNIPKEDREGYERFGMPRKKFRKWEKGFFESRAQRERVLRQAMLISGVLADTHLILQGDEEPWTHNADFMRFASLAICRLGGTASYSDLHLFLLCDQTMHRRGTKAYRRISRMIQSLLDGDDFSPMRDYVWERLRAACDAVRVIQAKRFEGLGASMPEPFYRDPENGLFDLDRELMDTDYHLYMSFLPLFGAAGHA